MFVPAPEHAAQIVMNSPVLSQRKFRQRVQSDAFGGSHVHIDLNFPEDMQIEEALEQICYRAEQGVRGGKLLVVVSDQNLREGHVPVHALAATGAVHHHLVKTGLRCDCNLLIDTATARDPHHFACLIGYGATAVCPHIG